VKKLALIPLAAVVVGIALLPTLIGNSASPPQVITVQAAAGAKGIRHGDCKACHVFHGRVISQRNLPTVPHEIDGSRSKCTFCHGKGRLVSVPSTHWGTPDSECLTCHKQSPVLAAALAPAVLADPDRATLPASHKTWNKFSCLLCHRPAKSSPASAPQP
jgi:hypothetical protein